MNRRAAIRRRITPRLAIRRRIPPRLAILLPLLSILFTGWACKDQPPEESTPHEETSAQELEELVEIVSNSSNNSNPSNSSDYPDNYPDPPDSPDRYQTLTEADFQRVAEELGVEVAAIKAVVEIEAGKQMKGFYAPGVPVVNFDQSMYNRCRAKCKGAPADKSATVPSGLSGYALKEWRQLTNARHVNADAANMGTFWGMFQIGGFNYKACGCSSVAEMVELMSDSEFEQLELFARFITNSGMLQDLKAKNWAAFARKYNGASYARRGYHTRMAQAYTKYKK